RGRTRMNGVHDMGGMHGMGPIKYDPNEPVFHEPWEGRVWGFIRTLGPWTRGRFGASRFDLERMPPDFYLRASYYERWFGMLVNRLLRGGLITPEELASGKADRTPPPPTQLPAAAPPPAAPGARAGNISRPPRFRIGARR